MKKTMLILAAAALLFCSAACTHRLQVDPIHITVDINIKVDRALDDFFGDLDEMETETPAAVPEETSKTPSR